MLRPQGFIFGSSPNAVTPYHFDPEHNILLQLRGTKVVTQFPAGDLVMLLMKRTKAIIPVVTAI